jgi:hypothetical protein
LNQNAPSVEYPVGRFFWAAYWPIGLATLSFLALSASLLVGLFEGWPAAILFGTWVLLTFFSVYSLKSRLAKSWLCWDGHAWQVQSVISLPTQALAVAPSPASSIWIFSNICSSQCSIQHLARSGFGLQSVHSLSVGMDFVALYIRNQNEFSVQRLNWSLGSL